jgi:acyl-coenzyme A thioesterase PaaI-like protein
VPDEINPRRLCFGCGDLNSCGLKLDFRVEGNRATAEFVPEKRHQGYPGLVHGGVTAAALDEAMGWAMYGAGVWAMTGKMEVKFRRPFPLGHKVAVTGELTRNRGRWLEVRGEVRGDDGTLVAESRGIFMRLPEEKVRELEETFFGSDPERGERDRG